MNTRNNRALNAMRNARGRFFGLYTTQGESLKAQFNSETPNYVNVYDRNAGMSRKIAKSSVCGVRIESQNFGRVF